jgi:hypothetical protein
VRSSLHDSPFGPEWCFRSKNVASHPHLLLFPLFQDPRQLHVFRQQLCSKVNSADPPTFRLSTPYSKKALGPRACGLRQRITARPPCLIPEHSCLHYSKLIETDSLSSISRNSSVSRTSDTDSPIFRRLPTLHYREYGQP